MDIRYVDREVRTIKRSISFKIVVSYIFIIISTLIIVGFVFSFLAKIYTEKQSKNQLVRDANAIFDIIINEELTNNDITSIKARQSIRKKVISQIGSIESNFALVSKDLKILYPKNEEAEQFKQYILPKIKEKLDLKTKKTVSMKIQINKTEYLLVILPPRSNVSQSLRGWIVLYNPVGPVQKLIKSILFVLLVSLMIAAIIAIIAGIFIARSIAKPIIMLKDKADALARLDFDGSVKINTGDELEELGITINKMAIALKEHDITQKRFFQNASHELKTPLMSIQGYAEGVKEGVFDNNDEALDIIVRKQKTQRHCRRINLSFQN
jgi:nitrogen fixation/metabolism regulation signal transduction histidine kinase